MKPIIISGKKYAIAPHAKNTHYDLFKWEAYGENNKVRIKTGKLGTWQFFKCMKDLPHLAKVLLNMSVNDETVKDVQTMLNAWNDAVAAIVQALEENVE